MNFKTSCMALAAGVAFSTTASAQDDAKFAPQAAADAVLNICASDGFSGEQTALEQGLRVSDARKDVAWALATDAQVWELNSRDGEVMLYAYGPQKVQCGVLMNFSVPLAGRHAVSNEISQSSDFKVLSETEISAGVHFIRMFNEHSGRYIDIVDYPSSRSSQGLIKIELVAN